MSFALITGASKGIGKAIAMRLASQKKDLLLVARNEDRLKELCSRIEKEFGVTARYLPTDLTEKQAAKKVYDWCLQNNYAVNVLVNNAGYGLSGPFEKYSLHDHLNMMQLNMNTLVELTHYFLPLLQKQPRAYILNIASSAAYQAVPFLSLYAATKTFVLRFSRGLNYELKNTNVSVTCVCPGPTDTDFSERAQVGAKGLKLSKKFNMQVDDVAKIAIHAMYKRRSEVITGLINKWGAFFAWLLPKKMIEKTSAKIYQ